MGDALKEVAFILRELNIAQDLRCEFVDSRLAQACLHLATLCDALRVEVVALRERVVRLEAGADDGR